MNASRTVYVRALFEPIKKLRVNLTSNWSRSRNSSEYIVYDGADFQSLNKMYSGNFSMSAIGLKSAFIVSGIIRRLRRLYITNFWKNGKEWPLNWRNSVMGPVIIKEIFPYVMPKGS